MKTIINLSGAVVLAALVTGCAPGLGSGTYKREEARREQSVRLGTIESLRDVRIEGTRSGIGPAAGAVIGGIAGNTVGQGRGAAVGAVVGGVAGGVAGQAAEQAATRKNGVEITIKLDSGPLIAITQEAGDSFRVGERIRVLSDGMTSRVTR